MLNHNYTAEESVHVLVGTGMVGSFGALVLEKISTMICWDMFRSTDKLSPKFLLLLRIQSKVSIIFICPALIHLCFTK